MAQPANNVPSSLLGLLRWLPVTAWILFQTLVLVSGALREAALAFLKAVVKPRTPVKPLHSATSDWPAASTCWRRAFRDRAFS
uniref:Uncharacterized protein n=1 Tax=Anguilla anguilla TaxID=7936 RepID=A0A0E9PDQ1_ANGAN